MSSDFVNCYCSECNNGQFISIRRAQMHLEKDREMLSQLQSRSEAPELTRFLTNQIQRTVNSLYGQHQATGYQDSSSGATEQAPLAQIPPSISTPPHLSGDAPHENVHTDSDYLDVARQDAPSFSVEDNHHDRDDHRSDVDVDLDHLDLNSDVDKEQDFDTESVVSEERVSIIDYDSDTDDELDAVVGNSLRPLGTTVQSAPPIHDHQPSHVSNLQQSSVSIKGLEDLKAELKETVVPLPKDPPPPPQQRTLTRIEELSLQHYSAWQRSGGTIKAYELHARVLEAATGISILSLYKVERLADSLTNFHPRAVDMCPKSCIAYTGKYAALDRCPYVSTATKKECQLPRYKKSRGKQRQPAAQYMSLPFSATIHALYGNTLSSRLSRNRDELLKKVIHLIATAGGIGSDEYRKARTYSDFGNSHVHVEVHHRAMGLFQDPRDMAFALSTDGAQLTMKKHSNTWILILILLNLPADIRYKSSNVIISFAIPGPNSPGDIESFMRPLFEELAQAAEGLWIWDALESSYFIFRAHVVMGLGDMLGSAKMNGMAGHSALHGDRFTTIQAARSSDTRGSKAQYYPMLKGSDRLNPDRPSYNFNNLPMRRHDEYFKILKKLEDAANENQRKIITKATGVVRLPLCATSPAFFHPTFFPLDPFHLIYENCTAFIWDLWTVETSPEEITHLSIVKAIEFGQLLESAMPTLPPSFCGPIRDIHLKRQSQYKIYEWMALLHWYMLPIGLEIGIDISVLRNLSQFVRAMDFAMTIAGRNEEQIYNLRDLIVEFLTGFERLYIGNRPELNSRARLCMFQLVHIPTHIYWQGSIRVSSQSTTEREIGQMGHKIRSKKAPFSNLANLIVKRERIKILSLHYPALSLDIEPYMSSGAKSDLNGGSKLKAVSAGQQRLSFTQSSCQPDTNSPVFNQIVAIFRFCREVLDFEPQFQFSDIERWGKIKLSSGRVLQSEISYTYSVPSRRSCWFSAVDSEHRLVFGKALAFYEVQAGTGTFVFAVYHQLSGVESVLGCIRGTRWSEDISVIHDKNILDIVGIWDQRAHVYILQKHAGLDLLEDEDCRRDWADSQAGDEAL